MNPDLEKYIQRVIEYHKKAVGNRFDWSNAVREIKGLQKSDQEALRLGMIEMAIIKEQPANQHANTVLNKFEFDLEKYKKELSRDNDKKWYDSELAKKQYFEFDNIQKRAKNAVYISKLALLISGLGFLLLLIKLIFLGK